MGPRDERQSVVLVELVHHSRSEQPAHSAVVLRPSVDLLGVRPHQIAKGALRGYLLHSVDLPDLVERVNIRREAAVNAKNVI